MPNTSPNRDHRTVDGFGAEWTHFDQTSLGDRERISIYEDYFRIFPWSDIPPDAEGFDLGCGSGRWAMLTSKRVRRLHCIDASEAALGVARRNLAERTNCELHLASVESIPLPDNSQDFGYSLGVLHHVPDTAAGLKQCVAKLKPGAPFLVYLYYALDHRPWWFRTLWAATNQARLRISRLPEPLRRRITDGLALTVYLPLARASGLAEQLGISVDSVPLSYYRRVSFYTMRTDARDRFGTPLEQRFTKGRISEMMSAAGLRDIRFSDSAPFWCAVGFKATKTPATASEA